MHKINTKTTFSTNLITSFILPLLLAFSLTGTLKATVCEGEFTLSSQAEVNNFTSCDTIVGKLIIAGDNISDLSPLYGIVHISDALFVIDCPQLTTIQNGFPNLVTADILSISRCDNLQIVDGFNKLESLSEYLMSGLTTLQSISGFEMLQSISVFDILTADMLNSLVGFNQLTQVDNIRIGNCPQLTNLDIFSSVTGILTDGLGLFNLGVENLNGLSGISEITSFLFIRNLQITDLIGLPNLVNLNQDVIITIEFNPLLESISGLPNFSGTGGIIRIQDNPMLNACCSISDQLEILSANGAELTIQNNAVGCNSTTEILSVCSMLDCNSDIFISSQAALEDFAAIGCDSLFGNLIIDGGNTNDLTPLDFIKYIEGELTISNTTQLQTLQGFNNLTFVGQGVNILSGGGIQSITAINGFQNLETIADSDLIITDNNNLTEINGFQSLTTLSDIIIERNPITTINGFDALESVTNFSLQSSRVTNLEFLSSLISATGSLKITNNNNLPNFSGLNNLETIGLLSINNNEILSNIDDLESLEAINEIEISTNFNLSSCCSVLPIISGNSQTTTDIIFNRAGCNSVSDIVANCSMPDCVNNVNLTSQAELEAFAQIGCDSLFGNLIIEGDGITDLTPLNFIKYIGGALSIVNTGQLQTVEGFNNLTYVGSGINIPTGGSSITSINGFQNLETIAEFDLIIIGYINLTEINGFQKLTTVRNVLIEANPELEVINGFDMLESVNRFSIVASKVTDIDFLSSIKNVEESILIAANNELINIQGVSSLQIINGDLTIAANPNLANLNGLQDLEKLNRLRIIDNISLSNLDDLESLTEVAELDITGNIDLGDCCTIAPLISENTQLTTDINTNGEGCSTIGEIFSNCGIQDCFSDVNLTSQSELDAFAQTGCDSLFGSLIIEGNGITDLTPLNFIKYIGGALSIVNTNQLQTIEGFNNLTFIGEGLNIPTPGSSITSINTFQNLENVTDIRILQQSNLGSINGFQKLFEARDIIIEGNPITEINGFNILETVNTFSFVGSKVTNLDFLMTLVDIETSLSIAVNDELTDIQGLSFLESILGNITIAGNSKLTNLNGLNNLRGLTTLLISDNNALINIEALEALVNFETLIIHGNASLSMCCTIFPLIPDDNSSFVDISNNDTGCASMEEVEFQCEVDDCNADVTLTSQNEVNNWLGCEEVAGTLTISGADITDLSPLSTLQGTNALFILDNPLLSSLDGLENLSEVGVTVVLVDNESLIDVTALSGLTSVGDFLYFLRNNALTNLDGLQNLETVGDFFIDENQSLQNIDALTSLTSINGRFEILSSPALQNIDGLSNVTLINEDVILAGCPALESILGLQSVNTVNGRIIVSGTGTSTLAGLENIESASALSVDSNPNLTNLDALSNLMNVEDLEITNNINLTDCCGIFPLLNMGTISGNIDISNNPSPCSAQNEIFTECGGVNGGNDTDVQGVDLFLAVEPMHLSYVPFKDMTFTISLSNRGTESAQDIVVDVPEASRQLGSGNFAYTWHILDNLASSRGNFNPSSTNWSVSRLDPGETVNLTIVLYVLAEDQPLSFFTQVISSFPQDADATPNNDSNGIADEDDEAATVIFPVDNNTIFTDIELTVTADKRDVEIGETVNIFVQVSNKSSEDANNIQVAPLDILNELGIMNSNTTLGSFDEQSQLWFISLLEKNSTATLQIATTVQDISGFLRYSWQLIGVNEKERDSSPNNGFGNNLDHEDDEDSIDLFERTVDTSTDFPDLELSLDCDTPFYMRNTNIVYTLTVTNTGTAFANIVVIDWQLPSGLAHAGLTVSLGTYSSWSGVWNLVEPLAPGESAEIQFEVYTKIGDQAITSYAQVISLEEFDEDSTPGNGICCASLEDDEAAFTIVPANSNLQSRTNLAANTDFELSPNPTSERINLSFEAVNGNSKIEIIDLQGQVVLQRDFQHGDGHVDISLDVYSLPNGLYYLKVLNQNHIEPVSFVKI